MIAAICIALALFLTDRLLKVRARRGLLQRRWRLLELTHLENRGVALGLLAAHPRQVLALGCAAYALALALLLPCLPRGNFAARLGLLLLTCGGGSNLADRIARGSVTDYLRFPRLPGRAGQLVWNVADLMLLAAAMLLMTAVI